MSDLPLSGLPVLPASDPGPEQIRRLLRRRRMPEAFVRAFLSARAAALRGPAWIREAQIEPVEALPRLSPGGAEASAADRARTVAITLNGGLGTTMGMQAPKALLHAANGRTFLDLTLQQAEAAGVRPLLMNSFATDRTVRAELDGGDAPVECFLQHLAPKLDPRRLAPVRSPGQPALAWCPPGHGDLYTALGTSGALSRLLDAGVRYAFLSNVDNLGGWPDPRILGHFIASGAPFLMEVVRRTEGDWKGGHLARRRGDGGLVLRETAQCAPEDREAFRDAGRYRYFNANNLWMRLEALRDALDRSGGFLPLPVIVNPKTTDPRDPESPPCVHLEQAAGSAISVLPGATAIEAPRRRFAPVKTTANLLVLRSDVYDVGGDGRIEARRDPPPLELDPGRYRFVSDLETRFPHGPPSLVACDRLRIEGDVRFGRNVVCEGAVTVIAGGETAEIPDGTRLSGVVRV